MERMTASVKVVDHNFDYVVVVYYVCVGRMAVDNGIGRVFPDTQGCVERGHLRFDIGYVVDCESEITF